MRLRGSIVLSLFLFLVLLMLIVFIVEARRHSQVMQCQSNLRGLAISCLNYYNDFNSYPIGTVVSKTLQPEDRLSWMTRIFPTYVEGGYSLKIDWEKGWDTPENNPPMLTIKFVAEPEACGKMTCFLCPSYQSDMIDKPLSVTCIVGISGVGEDAATLPVSHARAGMFGNDRRVTKDDIKDGFAHTMLAMETLDAKPWTAGGYATMMAFIPGKPSFGLTGRVARGSFTPRLSRNRT